MAYGENPGQDPGPTYSLNQSREQHEQALTVKCTYCGAHIGQPCRNTITAQPLKHTAGHTPRLIDAINTEIPF